MAIFHVVTIIKHKFMTQQVMKYSIYILSILTPILLLASGCSERSHPDSPEPTLTMGEAIGVTRTEATLTATIDRHGGPALSYVTLRCKDESEESGDGLAIEGDPLLSAFEFHLSDLCPGTGYICHLEAGTTPPSLKSNTIKFTTIPNDPPKVSGITPLSTGPLGIMVRFSITDAGGEDILEAGCEVKENGSKESRRIYVTGLYPLPELLQLSITGLTPATTYIITPFASNIQGETRGETMVYTTSNSVVLTEPGTLADLFDTYESTELEILTIAGPMDGDDLRTLRAMLGAPSETSYSLRVTAIDMSDVSIKEGGVSYDGQRFTVADHVSTGMFADCALLQTAVLPNSATAVDRDAFARCHALEKLTLPANAETILPSTDCPKLKAICTPLANTRYASRDGVLLNGDESQIVWFPCGKTGEYSFPSTITAIGENAFAGTSITTLIVPTSVTVISRGAFAGSDLREIRLPDNLTNIAEGTFQNCTTLTTVRLGAGTEFLGDYAFDGTDLTDLYIAADYPPYANTEAFSNRLKSLTEECTLHVPTGTRKLYRSNARWGKFTKIEEFQP